MPRVVRVLELMARYTDDSKERVRDAVDMVDLVGARTELRRAGANRYIGLCPFHDERTPSFAIDPARSSTTASAAARAATSFTFVQETEGLDFAGALECSPTATASSSSSRRRTRAPPSAARAARAAARAARAHRGVLRALAVGVRRGRAARASTSPSRGLEEAVLREFRVGYAPSAWDTRAARLAPGRLHRPRALDAGLAQRGQRGRPDLRPLPRAGSCSRCATRAGACSASARARCGADQQPKYLNTSEDDVYHKGRHLFGGRPRARRTRRRPGAVIAGRGLHRRASRCTRPGCATRSG